MCVIDCVHFVRQGMEKLRDREGYDIGLLALLFCEDVGCGMFARMYLVFVVVVVFV